MLPYSRQDIDDADVAAVVETLRSDWLTTGPAVPRFEAALAVATSTRHAVAVSSGTAALHAALSAAGVGAGDEVIVPAITFVATASVAAQLGARPVVVDVDPRTLLIDPDGVERVIGPRTRALVAVDYAGQPAPYAMLRRLADTYGLTLVADACHALGAAEDGRPVGGLADLTAFSFHPVKAITSIEGGAVTTDDATLAERVRRFRNHGLTRDHRERSASGSWRYDVEELGVNARLGDVQCALAESQLARLRTFLTRRRSIARAYDEAFAGRDDVRPLATRSAVSHARHLYVVEVDRRDLVFAAMRARGIGVNVHYRPVHLLSVMRRRFGTRPGDCPAAEAAAERILTLPCFPGMTDGDVERVLASLDAALVETAAVGAPT